MTPPIPSSDQAPSGEWSPLSTSAVEALLPVGAYSVEALIGHGNMGAVYKATQLRLKRPVAIKIMRQDAAADADFSARFLREAHTLARLSHPGIVHVIDCGKDGDDLSHIIMEFVDGVDLKEVLRPGPMPQEKVLELLPQISDALQFAHDNGIVHRDIKPSNILIGRNGRVKLVDFGLARPLDPGSRLQSGSQVSSGTPFYAAPEQFTAGAAIDHRADVFALGVLLYQMLTGQLPRGAWQPPSHTPGVHRHWDAIVERAMQQSPEDRYESVSQLCSAALAMQAPNKPEPAARRMVHRHTRALLVTGFAALALGFAGWLTKPWWWPTTASASSHASITKASPSNSPPLEPLPPLPPGVRVWDAASKIPKKEGVTWEDNAMRLDNMAVTHSFPVTRRVALKASIRVPPPQTTRYNLHLLKEADGGRYVVYLNFDTRKFDLLSNPGLDQPSVRLRSWSLPRSYLPGQWVAVELRVDAGVLSVSLDGKLLGSVHDATYTDFSMIALWGMASSYFRDIEYVPLDGVTPPVATFPAGQWSPIFRDVPAPGTVAAYEDGWTLDTTKKHYRSVRGPDGNPFQSAAGGLRGRFRGVLDSDYNWMGLQLRNMSGAGYSFGYLPDNGRGTGQLTMVRIDKVADTYKHKELVKVPAAARIPAGTAYSMEFYAIGSLLIGRLNDQVVTFKLEDDPYAASGGLVIVNTPKCFFRDMEVLPLDGLPEAEALKLAGVDKDGNDLRAKADGTAAPPTDKPDTATKPKP